MDASHHAASRAGTAAQSVGLHGLSAMTTATIANPLSARSRAGWLLAWAAFWLLMFTVAVQDYLRGEGGPLWRPLLWEGSACLVATVMLGVVWHHAPRHDGSLTQPARWFALQLRWLPLLAPLFVTLVYALRHAVYALLDQSYNHSPWPQVYLYECTKFALFFMLFAAIVFGLRTHAALAEARLRTQAAQLAQLTQQLEPHFLFNALNTIAATVHDKPDLADSLLTRLAALLRATTDLTRRPSCTLDEELKLVDGYAAIMCERFADRVSLRVDVDADARACRVPTLAIQPLLENAFRHGVERSSETTALTLRAQRRGDRLRVEVEQSRGDVAADSVAGVGLGSLRERLAALHGERAQVGLAARAGGGTVAWFELPAQA
jgi:signal transduction histidine kinase